MARLVTIPTGVQNRRGSDGSGFAVGKQTASGVPLTHLNYTSAAATDNIASGQASGASISFFLDNHGEGPITITTNENVLEDTAFVVTGRDADGDVQTETVTVSAGSGTETGSDNFAGIYLTAIDAPASILVAGQSLATTADLTTAITLSTFTGEHRLTFTITGADAGGGTIAISGQDAGGNNQTETLTFTGATGTETTTNAYVTTNLTATPATFTQGTANANLVLDGTWSASVTTVNNTVTGGIVPILYPISNLDMNEDAATEDSDLITSLGAATPPDIGQYSGHMNFTTGVLTEELPYLIAGILPTTGGNSTTAVATQSAGAAIAVPANGNVPITPPALTTHPSKIKIVFATAPASGTLTIAGYTKIGSKQRDRRYRTETITLGAGTTYESQYYYVSDTAGTPNATPAPTITASTVGTPGAAAFTLDPELYTMTFMIHTNDVQFDGWSAQGLVGGEPRVAYNVVPSLWNINASPTGVSFEMQCPTGEVSRKRTIQGGDLTEPFLDADYINAESTRFGGWSGAFRYGTELVKMTNLAIAFNRNLNPDDAVDGGRFADDVEATDDRIITVAPTTRFRSSYQKTQTVNNWQDVFREQTRQALSARWYHYSGRGQRRQMIFNFPSCLIVESPQSTVGGASSIDEPLSLQAFADGTTTEFSVTLFLSKAYSV